MTTFTDHLDDTGEIPTNTTIEEYVGRCSAFLWDLSPALQDQLRDDIRQIVGEVAMELNGRPDDLVGPPSRFVAELRSAAGLRSHTASEGRPGQGVHLPPRHQTRDWTQVARILDSALRWLRAKAVPGLADAVNDIRPAWWVARALGVAFVLGMATSSTSRQGLVPNVFHQNWLSMVASVVLIVASVRLGRTQWPRTRGRRFAVVAVSVLGLWGFVLWADNARLAGFDAYVDEISADVDETVSVTTTFQLARSEPMMETDAEAVFAPDGPTDVVVQDARDGRAIPWTSSSDDTASPGIDILRAAQNSGVPIEFLTFSTSYRTYDFDSFDDLEAFLAAEGFFDK